MRAAPYRPLCAIAFVLAGCAHDAPALVVPIRPVTVVIDPSCVPAFERLEVSTEADVQAGKLDDALKASTSVLRRCESELGVSHVATARVRTRRAWVLMKSGAFDEAMSEATDARAVFERELGLDNNDVATVLQVMVSAALNGRHYERARELALESVLVREHIGPPANHAGQLRSLGTAYLRLDKQKEAKAAFERSLEIAKANFAVETGEVAEAMAVFGEFHRFYHHLDEAEPLLVDSLAVLRRVSPDTERLATATNNVAAFYHYGRRDLKKAEGFYRTALEIHERHLPADHPNLAQVKANLGTLLCEEGKVTEGEPMYETAILRLEAVAGKDAPEVKRQRDYFAKVMKKAK